MRCRWYVLVFLVLVASKARGDIDPTYAALRAARPDGRRVPVQGFVLERDVFRFRFDSGAFHFLAPVAGRTVGVVFIGHGSLLLTPATPSERRHLALASGAEGEFSEEFNELVLLFVDDTGDEIALHASMETRDPDPRALQVYEAALDRHAKVFKANLFIRILQDLLNTPGLTSGIFLASFQGQRYAPAIAAVDPHGAGALRLGDRLGGEDSLLFVADAETTGIWYHCDQQTEVRVGKSFPEKRLADAVSYRIETDIVQATEISGAVTIRFKSLVSGLRLVPVSMLPMLRLSDVSYAGASVPGSEILWKPATFVQEPDLPGDDAAVILPEAVGKGAEVLLKLAYQGKDVLTDADEQVFAVKEGTSWYPRLEDPADLADYELLFRVPEKSVTLSSGILIEEHTENGRNISLWRSERPLRTVGFAYGALRKVTKEDQGLGLRVTAFAGTAKAQGIAGRDQFQLTQRGIEAGMEMGESHMDSTVQTDVSLLALNTSSVAESALEDSVRVIRLYTNYFGPPPVRDMSVFAAQHQRHSQSWPSVAVVQRLGFTPDLVMKDIVRQCAWHELAHQWWGLSGSAATYRDEWIEEGLADLSTGLAAQKAWGLAGFISFWQQRRSSINQEEASPAQVEPIAEGWRLTKHSQISSYPDRRLSRAGYVFHMLRMMMFDGSSRQPDERFIAMLQDFARTYADRQFTTVDLKRVVERYMTPMMDIRKDGKLDWFFNQWVYGTEVPSYKADVNVAKGKNRKYWINGTVEQVGVSPDFHVLVPVYVETGKQDFIRVGELALTGTEKATVDILVTLPRKPKRVVINAFGDVLTRE